MPQGDRTGPMGQGSMTGRLLGFCSGYNSPGYTKGASRGMKSGMGRGAGFGRGRQMFNNVAPAQNFNWPFSGFFNNMPWSQNISKDDEIKMLKAQAETLKKNQNDIEKRLSELEKI